MKHLKQLDYSAFNLVSFLPPDKVFTNVLFIHIIIRNAVTDCRCLNTDRATSVGPSAPGLRRSGRKNTIRGKRKKEKPQVEKWSRGDVLFLFPSQDRASPPKICPQASAPLCGPLLRIKSDKTH